MKKISKVASFKYIQRIRIDEPSRERLVRLSQAIVLEDEKSPNRRSDSSDIAPMVRALGDTLFPVRIEEHDLKMLGVLMQLFIDPTLNLSDPIQVGPSISLLLKRITTGQLLLVPK